MNRRFFAASLLAFAAGRGSAAPAAPTRHEVMAAGRRRVFHLSGDADERSPAPLLLLLHGSGQTGLDMLQRWTRPSPPPGLVLAAPDAASREHWHLREDGPAYIREIVRAVGERRAIDARRIYLFGHSAGAVYSLTLSMLESERFAATAVHAGAWRDRREFAALQGARRRLPVAIFVGDTDPYFPLHAVRATERALREAGHPVQVTVLRNHGHRYARVAPEVNAAAWAFLAPLTL